MVAKGTLNNVQVDSTAFMMKYYIKAGLWCIVHVATLFATEKLPSCLVNVSLLNIVQDSGDDNLVRVIR